MREIYYKYFKVPEEGKGIMGENVFFAQLAVSIACIVLCMSAMGFSAYAYFTASVSSSMNQIQAANFELNVEKLEALTEKSSASCEAEKTYNLQTGTYSFLLKRVENDNSATTGYCQILVCDDKGNCQSVYTKQFGKVQGQEEPVNERTIQIKVEVETIVKFVPCWGTYSGTDALDEQAKMIEVDTNKVVSVMDIPSTTAIDEETKKTETTTSGTVTTTTPVETITTTEATTTTENTAPEAEEKKDDTVTESIETEDEVITESTEAVENTTSVDDTASTETQE